MNGHMIRVSRIVSSVLSGDQLPHVNKSTNCGANTMPSSVIALMNTAVSVATLFARRHADWSPSTAIFFENVVMNAVESAPSAKRSRNRFGNRNAMRNASRFRPAPNSPANTISRTSPSKRLDRMAMPTTPVARVLIRRSSAAAIGEHFVGRFCETPILNSAADLTTRLRPAVADLRRGRRLDTNEHECCRASVSDADHYLKRRFTETAYNFKKHAHTSRCSGACAKHQLRRLTQTPLQQCGMLCQTPML